MDFQGLLFNPSFAIYGVPAILAFGGFRSDVTVIDKTAGVDVGDDGVRGQTIVPACVIRAPEVLGLGVQIEALGGDNVTVNFNGVWWKVESYRMKPSPKGELDGEIYLILSKAPVLLVSTLTIPPPDFRDDLGVSAGLEVFWDFGILGPNIVPDFADETTLDPVMTVTTLLSAALADDLGISKAKIEVIMGPAAFMDDLGLSAILDVATRLAAAFTDEGTFTAIETHDFNATFADDLGFAAALGAFTILSAAITDDTGLDATVLVTTLLVANFADDLGLDAVETHDFIVSFADDLGLDAVLAAATILSAALADDTGLSVVLTFNLHADFADDTGFDATLTLGAATVELSAAIADDIGISANMTIVNAPPSYGANTFGSPSGTSSTIAYPSGIAAGDLLILVLSFGGTATTAITGLPSGWTIGGLNNNVGGNVTGGGSVNMTYAWKIADGLETGSITVGGWSSQQVLTFLTRYHSVDPVYPLIQVTGERTSTFGLGALVSRGPNSTFAVWDGHVTGNFMNTVSGWTRQFVSGNVGAVFDVSPSSGTNVNSTAFSENAGGTYQQAMFEIASYKNVQAMLRSGAALAPANSSFTFSNLAIGPAGSNRTVFAMLGCSNGQIPTGATIGGVTATKVDGWADSTFIGASLWYAAVPTGTTASVVVTCGATVANAVAQLYTTFASFNATPIYSNHSARGGVASTDSFTFTPSSDGALVLAFDIGTTAVSTTGSIVGDAAASNASIAAASGHNVAAAVSQTINFASGATRAIRAVFAFAPV